MELLIKLIAVGWGSSGYYSAEVLNRDGAKAFPSGTRILNTHVNNNAASPARQGQGVSGDDLVGKLTEDAYFDANHAEGPGLYANIQVYPDYVAKWGAEKLRDMEFSIFALADWEMGAAEGRSGRISKSLSPTRINSVDAVVFGGAGGKAIAAESAEFCTDGDCPITSINVVAVEATIMQRVSMVRDAFYRQFPRQVETEEGSVRVYNEFVDMDEEYVFIHNYRQLKYYRVSYSIENGSVSFADKENWQVVQLTRNFEVVAESHITESHKLGDMFSKELTMTLEEALKRIAELEATEKRVSAENAELTKQLATANSQLSELSTAHRAIVAESAVNDVLRNVTFIADEARGLVTAEMLRGIEWKEDGGVDADKLAKAAEAYTSGKSVLVKSEVAAESFNMPSYERPQTFKIAEKSDTSITAEFDNILDAAASKEVTF